MVKAAIDVTLAIDVTWRRRGYIDDETHSDDDDPVTPCC